MMRTLLVIPSLGYNGQAKQLTLLAAHLPKDRFEPRICVLGEDEALGEDLRAAGVPVECLSWTRPFDARPLFRLRRLIHEFKPELIHAWGFTALRACALMRGAARLYCCLPSLLSRRNHKLNLLDRWLLRQANGVVVSDRASLQLARGCMDLRSVHLVHPAVEPTPSATHRRDLCDAIGIPTNARLLVGVGPIEVRKGFRDAIWALDILKYLYDDVFLILVGDGPERQRLQDFARSIRAEDRVRFVGVQAGVQDWLRIAEVVWVPSLTMGGANVALEAMAAGRPVVASRINPLADIVVDGESGLTFLAGDKVALARHTHALLQDPAQASKLGMAGRKWVTARFSIAEMVRAYTDLHFGSPAPSVRRKAS